MNDDKLILNEEGLPPVERAMVIVAHPDDPEFFMGGTLAKLAKHGVEVRVLPRGAFQNCRNNLNIKSKLRQMHILIIM